VPENRTHSADRRGFFASLFGCIAAFIWTHLAYTTLKIGSTGLQKLPNETVTKKLAEKVARYPSGISMYNAAGSRPIERLRWLSIEFLTELVEETIFTQIRAVLANAI
jgi:hypothetical protein